MGANNQNSISTGVVIGKIAGLVATTIVFITAVFLAVFLFASRANAQSVSQFPTPHLACQYYYNQQGVTVVRDLEHDCLTRVGDNQSVFIYTHFYDSGDNFCLEITSSQGRIYGPECVLISQTGRAEQQQQDNPGTLITPPSFHIKELQYDTLPTGKQIQTGDDERIEIKMPDGSLIQLDANATFTPVSKYEVQSVFGRYRYLWTPFHDGKCIVGQNLARQECRKVKTRDAILGVTGTEFLVETNESGTTVTVLEGLLTVTDLSGTKTVKVAGGQSTYIKHGGLPDDPKAFDAAKIERWWEKQTFEQIVVIWLEIIGGLIVFLIILSSIRKKALRKKLSLMPAVSEASIVSFLGNHAADFNTQNFFPIVFPTEEINIRTHRGAEESLSDYKTFDFDHTNKADPNLEKELFSQLEKVLQARGLTRVTKSPQMIISMDFFIGTKKQYVPPTTVTSTKFKHNWTIEGDWAEFSSKMPATASSLSAIPGYATTTYYSNIRLNFLNHAKLTKGSKPKTPPLVWIGEADNEGLDHDILVIAPIMFSELMGEFPDQSANTPKRYICRSRYGGLGIGFDPTDWRIVRYVEPSSVAEEHGIKPGDVLLKVNGKRTVINWPALGHRYLSNPGPYRSRDPYFQHVLSSRGDSDVKLVIRSAETGKKVTISIRPRSESRYVQSNLAQLNHKITKGNPLGVIFVIIILVIIIFYFIK